MNHNITDFENSVDNQIRSNIKNAAVALIALLLVLLIYVSYVQSVESKFLASHPLNRRTVQMNREIQRGRVLDSTGKILAQSVPDKDGYKREYLQGSVFAHVIGYSSSQYGNAGIESSYDGYLSGLNQPEHRLGAISSLWKQKAGDDVQLTIRMDLQRAAAKELGSRRGAIVILEPKTGEILALVSAPSFDPAKIEKDWGTITGSQDSPLLDRALQGQYPPGSIIKTMTAEMALNEGLTDTKKIYNCPGELKIGNYILPESGHNAHGSVNLERAMAVSCNVTFGTLGMELGGGRITKGYSRYGFDKDIGGELGEKKSPLPDYSKLSDGELAQIGIGQGTLLVSPLRMAMLASTFANQGVMMKPYLVKKIMAPDGAVVKEFSPEVWLKPVKPELANEVKNMMIAVIASGTGRNARLSGITAAGKTGTAENPQGPPHAWFIGFAPADKPQVAIAVVVENGGSGGETAAPIAQHLMELALR